MLSRARQCLGRACRLAGHARWRKHQRARENTAFSCDRLPRDESPIMSFFPASLSRFRVANTPRSVSVYLTFASAPRKGTASRFPASIAQFLMWQHELISAHSASDNVPVPFSVAFLRRSATVSRNYQPLQISRFHFANRLASSPDVPTPRAQAAVQRAVRVIGALRRRLRLGTRYSRSLPFVLHRASRPKPLTETLFASPLCTQPARNPQQ